jgi:hypothetical protein
MTSNIEPRLRQYSINSVLPIYVKHSTVLYWRATCNVRTLRYGELPLLIHTHIRDLYREHTSTVYGITHSIIRPSMALPISIYIILKYGGPPADGGHPGGRWTGGHPGGRRTGGRYCILRVDVHAYATRMGEGRIRREPQRGGRKDVSTNGRGRW